MFVFLVYRCNPNLAQNRSTADICRMCDTTRKQFHHLLTIDSWALRLIVLSYHHDPVSSSLHPHTSSLVNIYTASKHPRTRALISTRALADCGGTRALLCVSLAPCGCLRHHICCTALQWPMFVDVPSLTLNSSKAGTRSSSCLFLQHPAQCLA